MDDRDCRPVARVRSLWALAIAALLAAVTFGCGARTPVSPSVPAVARIAVGNESFRVLLPTDALLTAARNAMAGGSARIPNGRIVAGTEVNVGYSWHLEDVTFVENTIELCDGAPSMVEREGTAFGGGRFCPWTARVVAIDPR